MRDSQADPSRRSSFGRRRVTPHVCLVSPKRHIRTFLAEAFGELGFVTHECEGGVEVLTAHRAVPVDLVAIAQSPQDREAASTLQSLAAAGFDGSVLLIGGRGSPQVAGARRLGEQLGLAMLPLLATPFRAEDLADCIAALRPCGPPPHAPIDLAEALENDWIELWYQPKIDPRSLLTRGAEALCRVRHPIWGVVPPARFIPAEGDPNFRELSEFVLARAVRDWRYFAEYSMPVQIAVNLPLPVLRDEDFVDILRRHIPSHPAFDGLIVELDGSELVGDLSHALDVATRLKSLNVGISIDDVGAEHSVLARLNDLPFVELKVDRQFVHDCANDALKRAVCSTIIDVAQRFGVRTVAEGVETREDLMVVRELGFDLAQGFLFAKAMEPRKFARTLLERRSEALA